MDRLDQIMLGGELCLRKNVTSAQMKEYVQSLYDYGMRLIRVYPYWAHIEETKGTYNLDAYDTCFSEASKLGMSIVFTFKPNSPPWWMRITSSYNLDDYPHVDEPEYWDVFLNYVRHIVKRYKDSPALLAWCVWNEPRISLPTSLRPQMLKEYRNFLRKLYHDDIEALNAHYFYQYASFDEVNPLEESTNPHPRRDMPEHTDFYRFCTDTLARKLRSISDTIHEIDKEHYTHINTHNTESQSVALSHNIWKEAESVDFVGTSIYPHYNDEFPDSARLNGFNCSLIRSATKDPKKRFWITEMQGGPAIYTGHTSGISVPEPEDLKLAIWDYIGGGAKGCIYWSYTPTVRGEWQLCGFGNTPTKRMHATKEVFDILDKNRELIENAKIEQPDVWILCDESSLIHDILLGRVNDYRAPLDLFAHAHAQVGAHSFLTKLGYVCGSINETRLRNNGLPENAVLIAPACTCLSSETVNALESFVIRGGTLIADALFGWKNEYALIDEESHAIVDRIFGASWYDFGDIRPSTKILDSKGREVCDPWFIRALFENRPGVICRYDTGEGAIVLNHYGKGTALRFGTDIFRHSLSKDMSGVNGILGTVLPQIRKNDVWFCSNDNCLHMHVMQAEGAKLLIILNYGDSSQEVSLNGADGVLRDLISGKTEFPAAVTVNAKGVRLLKLEESK